MKQVLQDFRSGALTVGEIPAPAVRIGSVLVANRFSLISSGTEGGTVRLGRMNWLQKARARPEQVKKVLGVVRTDGVLAAYQAVSRSLEIPIELGYCCAGEVLEVGEGVPGLRPGQLVACGGGGYAKHAEVVCVPRNLVATVPDGVPPRLAAFTTLGSIAMQGVRVAGVHLGETAVVIGLGLVGLLVVELLKAAGCRVFGVDVSPARVRFAEEQGFCEASVRGAGNLVERVKALSGGFGVDAVLVAAAAPDNDPVALAGELARPKARVVVVGRTEMNAPRETYLFKELELCTSLAYGPGTGDPSYEERGVDYPIGYVRWTENRNMQAFLGLLAAGRLRVEPLISHEFPIAEAARGFDLVAGGSEQAVAVLLRYDRAESGAGPVRRVDLPAAAGAPAAAGRVSVIGAGSFATNVWVPHLAQTPGLARRGIASAGGVRARTLAAKHGFTFCASDAAAILGDEDTDCVAILTRHDTHASLAAAALDAGKHVFVEKPLALDLDGLRRVVEAQARSRGTVQVGFNRRFAPLALALRDFFGRRAQPLSITYRANVGYRPPNHWLHDPVQGGGVLLGEAVHFVDFCHWLVGAEPVEVFARRVGGGGTGLIEEDTFHLSLGFADGSLATVIYASNGDPSLSRERVEVFGDDASAVLEDFRDLTCARGARRRRTRRRFSQDRGHAGQLAALAEALRTGTPAISFESLALSTLATLEAVVSLGQGAVRKIDRRAIGLP
ncbi:MAG: bi-domain-containing oxidoreductase [Deltaproteobacteria bacterium]|nr:bi-domain-containing oxidoreductase [Deltaproteobacteria bacterium]